MTYFKATLEQELAFCEDYQNTRLSKKELIIKHGLTNWAFTSIRNKHNVQKRKRNAPKKNLIGLNERYFENIDTNSKAYWLGFIAADGCIKEGTSLNSNSCALSVGLAVKDINHLEKLKKDLESESTISIEKSFHKKMQKYYETAYLKIGRTILCEDLITNGVGRNKSKELSLPKISDDLMRHYIRGYFDGDGCWTISHNRLSFGIISSIKSFTIEIQNYIKQKCDLENSAKIFFNKNAYQFIYSGNIQTKRIYDYLYGEGGPWLDRKYKKSTDHFISRGHDLTEQTESLDIENLNTLWNEKESKEKND